MKFFVIFAALFAVGNASLGSDVRPVLAAVNPTAEGVDRGLHAGAGHVKAAVQNLGATLAQVADAVADVGGNTAAGLGTTAGKLPAAAYQTVHRLSTSKDAIGALLRILFGSS